MGILDKFPIKVLEGMRRTIDAATPDAEGMIYESIPNVKRNEPPHRVSTNKAASLQMIDAAIARRGATAVEAEL